jgi:hypothetical protein
MATVRLAKSSDREAVIEFTNRVWVAPKHMGPEHYELGLYYPFPTVLICRDGDGAIIGTGCLETVRVDGSLLLRLNRPVIGRFEASLPQAWLHLLREVARRAAATDYKRAGLVLPGEYFDAVKAELNRVQGLECEYIRPPWGTFELRIKVVGVSTLKALEGLG